MKTHTIKTPTAELLVVELAEGWDYEPITDDKTFIYHKTEEGTNDHHIEGYTLLGKPDEIAENEKWDVYKPYKGSMEKETAKESLLSLLETEIYWDVNPIEKPPKNDLNGSFFTMQTNFHKEIQYEEAEQKTFNRNRSIIFKKKI